MAQANICTHTGLPCYCCAHCKFGIADNSAPAHGWRKRVEDDTPYYGSGSTAMSDCARTGESTGRLNKPAWSKK